MNFKKVIIHLKYFFSLSNLEDVIDGIQCKFSTIDIK